MSELGPSRRVLPREEPHSNQHKQATSCGSYIPFQQPQRAVACHLVSRSLPEFSIVDLPHVGDRALCPPYRTSTANSRNTPRSIPPSTTLTPKPTLGRHGSPHLLLNRSHQVRSWTSISTLIATSSYPMAIPMPNRYRQTRARELRLCDGYSCLSES